MTKDISINDKEANTLQTNGDNFGKDSLILIRLNKFPNDYKIDNLIKSEDCTVIKEYLIKSRKDVFDSVYNTGKEIYELLKEEAFHNLQKYFIDEDPSDELKKASKLKEIFNKYVQEHGYPFFIGKMPYSDDKVFTPNHYYFINECLIIYAIEELRKWIFKIRLQIKNNTIIDKNNSTTFSFPTYKIRTFYNVFKDKLISATMLSDNVLINDGISKEEILDILNRGLPADKANEKLTQEEMNYYEKFLKVLQRTLIYTVIMVTEIPGQTEQYIVSKRLPIYNKQSQQYRLYTIAYSLVGIAYDYLLFNLTATRESYERMICEFPDCNNEFEKVSKSNFCEAHTPEEIRAYTQHKYYIKKKEDKKKKKEKK